MKVMCSGHEHVLAWVRIGESYHSIALICGASAWKPYTVVLLAKKLVGPLDELHQRLRCGKGGILPHQVVLQDPTGP